MFILHKNSTVKIKLQNKNSIMHTSNLEKSFLDVDFSPTVCWFWLFCIAIIRGRFRTLRVWDGPLCHNICQQTPVIVTGSSVLGGSRCPDSTFGHHAVKHMLCSSFVLVFSVCCLPHSINFWFQNHVFCRIKNWSTNFPFNCPKIRSPDYMHLLLQHVLS